MQGLRIPRGNVFGTPFSLHKTGASRCRLDIGEVNICNWSYFVPKYCRQDSSQKEIHVYFKIRLSDRSVTFGVMWVKQCHEPAMASWNAFHHAPIYGDAGDVWPILWSTCFTQFFQSVASQVWSVWMKPVVLEAFLTQRGRRRHRGCSEMFDGRYKT